jgi:mono/diheme cytochrome c family protein
MAMVVWWILALAPALAAGQTPTPAQVEAGRRLYVDEKCSVCHQIAGQGNKRFPLDGVGRRLTAADLRRWFTHTVEMEDRLPKQPAIRMSSRKYRLSDAELDALVAYLQSLK